MDKHFKNLSQDINKKLDIKIKEVLLKNGFDCDAESDFNLISRVLIVENFNTRQRELKLDGKIIMTISDVKVEVIENKVSANIICIEV